MMERESKSLEYKEEVSKSYLKTVSAYANYGDGVIVFGVADDYSIKGVKNPKDVCLNIKNQINDSIKPRPNFLLKINDDNTITLTVFKGEETPYRYNGKCYKRSDSSTVEVGNISENRLVLEGMNLSYEELPSKRQDLSFEILSSYLKSELNIKTFDDDVLKSLDLLNDKGYNNAAALLSDSNSFPGLDMVLFGSNINEMKKRATLTNISVLKQYEECLKLFEDEYVIEKIEGGFRKKYDLIPFEAFREALANSIIHRSYDIPSNIKIEMHSDRIIISSPGGLMPGMSVEAFMNGRYSYLRNPILANVLHRLKIVEIFATGIKRIKESYSNYADKPIFDINDSYIAITLPLKREISLSPTESRLFSKMDDNYAYSRIELEKLSGMGKDSTIRALNSLIEKGFVAKDGKAINTSYRKILS